MNEFDDRLARSLDGELSEEENARFWKEVLADERALDECLRARELDHDLRRLLSPSGSDAAFLRGVLGGGPPSRPPCPSTMTKHRPAPTRFPTRWFTPTAPA